MLSSVVLIGGLLAAGPASMASGSGSPKVLKFRTMVGVPRPYTGPANAIRGVAGGGLPWVIDSAKGELERDGEVEVKVDGLVIDPNDQAAIDAVKQWVYTPTLLNGVPVPVIMTVTVNFRLS